MQQRLVFDEKSFAGLDKTLRHLIEGLVESRTKLSTLTVTEAETTRSHVTAQIDRLQQLHLDDRQFDEITRSLFYADMFSRQEQVSKVQVLSMALTSSEL